MRKMGGRRKSQCRSCDYNKTALKEKKGGRFFKILIGVVVAHGMICVSLSYALAWLEHTQVVETVSSTIITEIVAPVVVYGFTKTVENIFQKNKLKFSSPIEYAEEGETESEE